MASYLRAAAQETYDAYATCLGGGGPDSNDEPDYAGDASWWLANPALRTAGAEALVPLQCVPPSASVACAPPDPDAAADVFFVHGTLASAQDGAAGAGNYDCRASLPAATRGYVLSQCACFNASARIFAPHYRYSARVGLDTTRGLDAAARHEFAYGDVAAAFDAFLAASGAARPLFLAGHSQGSILVARLLRERVAGDAALKARLVGAYLPGLALFATTAPPFPLANAPGSVGAVACWNCALDAAVFEYTLVGALCGGYRCLTAFPTVDAAGRAPHAGAFGWGAQWRQVIYAEIATGLAVKDGLLRVSGDVAALAFYATPTGCMHKWDYHLLWLDVRTQAGLSLAAWHDARA